MPQNTTLVCSTAASNTGKMFLRQGDIISRLVLYVNILHKAFYIDGSSFNELVLYGTPLELGETCLLTGKMGHSFAFVLGPPSSCCQGIPYNLTILPFFLFWRYQMSMQISWSRLRMFCPTCVKWSSSSWLGTAFPLIRTVHATVQSFGGTVKKTDHDRQTCQLCVTSSLPYMRLLQGWNHSEIYGYWADARQG